MGASLTIIDRHYGHLARDGREHAIQLLDTLHEARWTLVDARWTPKRPHLAGDRAQIREMGKAIAHAAGLGRRVDEEAGGFAADITRKLHEAGGEGTGQLAEAGRR